MRSIVYCTVGLRQAGIEADCRWRFSRTLAHRAAAAHSKWYEIRISIPAAVSHKLLQRSLTVAAPIAPQRGQMRDRERAVAETPS
jgi:hypothetical protein